MSTPKMTFVIIIISVAARKREHRYDAGRFWRAEVAANRETSGGQTS